MDDLNLEERRLERLRNLLTPMFNLPLFVKGNEDGRLDDIIKDTADKAEKLMPMIKEALRSDITLNELNQLYSDPENRKPLIPKTPQELFEDLIGKDNVENIIRNNWVGFSRKPFDIYKVNEIEIEFYETDGKGDQVIHCTVCYNEDTEKWSSENCIDHPEIPYDTFQEMKAHLKDIEDDIINNGFRTINLPNI
jgi:hypothetical protein